MFRPINLSAYTDPVLDELVSGVPQIDNTILLDLARKADGPVLEIGCGYGRLTIPLAMRGIVLTGIELCGCYSPEKQALFLPQLLGTEKGQPSAYAISVLEIGYALSSDYRGRGYATEAIKALLTYAFTTLKVERIYASTNRSNQGSIALMERVGMRTASNPHHPELEWPGAPGVLGVIENTLL